MSNVNAIIERQIQRWHQENKARGRARDETRPPNPVITISRTLGSGGSKVANLVAQRMNLQVYEKEIIEKIAERSDVRQELVESLDEQSRSRLQTWLDGMLRNRLFDEGDYFHHLIQVLMPLVDLGSVVIVGRGANYILHRHLTLDVRIIAPIENRIVRLQETPGVTRLDAIGMIERSDDERSRFIWRLFERNWSDSMAYHLTINTAEISLEAAAELIESAWNLMVANCKPRPSANFDAL